MPSKVMSNHGGILDLYLHTVNGVHRVAAPVPLLPASRGGHARGLRYGRFAVRFRAAQLHCYKTAWLLWPDSGVWPRDGEIDFPEGDLDSTIHGFVHYRNGTSGSDQYAMPDTGVAYKRWHTAVIAWRPRFVRFWLDGRKVGETRRRIPNKPMHWVLQTETGLSGCVPSPFTQGHVLIDWVAIYKLR
jgi:beta-glucanase (GH16 family)